MTEKQRKEQWSKLPKISHPLKKNVKYQGSVVKWSSGYVGYNSVEYRW